MTEADLIAWGDARPNIRALLLTSTRAIPTAHRDALSDWDVVVVTDALAPWADDRRWITDFGEELVTYWDPLEPGYSIVSNVVQYADGLKIDFTIQSVATFHAEVAGPRLPDELDAGFRVLLDKDGLTTGVPTPTGTAYLPKPPTEAEFLLHVNDFLTDAPYVAKCLWRGELFPAKWALDHDMKHVYLRPVLEWRAQCDYGWAQPIGSLGKGLHRYLPTELWAELEATYVGADREENADALRRTLALFRRAATEVAQHLGYRYPDPLHERVCAFTEALLHRPTNPEEKTQ